MAKLVMMGDSLTSGPVCRFSLLLLLGLSLGVTSSIETSLYSLWVKYSCALFPQCLRISSSRSSFFIVTYNVSAYIFLYTITFFRERSISSIALS